MLVESIVFAIFICSISAIVFILVRKAPVLTALSQNGKMGIREHRFILNVENRIKNVLFVFKKQIFLHKLLSWIKVLTIKIEVKVDHLLHSIRRKAQEIDNETKNK